MMQWGDEMNATEKLMVYVMMCIASSVIFLIVSTKRHERDKLMLVQNVFNIPLMMVFLSVNLTGGGDPQLGLWAIMLLLTGVPTAVAHLILAFILPIVNLIKRKEKPRPKIYWINVGVLILEAVSLPFVLV